MMKKLFARLRSGRSNPRVYSRVVADEDQKIVVELLRQAAQEANADQKNLVRSGK